MNEHVAEFLNSLVETLDDEIKWEREHMSKLRAQTHDVGQKLDKLLAERRAVLDHLERHA
jgi:hypothetical protein